MDEHFYTNPKWFVENTDYYDKFPRDIKVFFGEYVAHPLGWMDMNRPEGNNLEGAVAEAAFLTEIEITSGMTLAPYTFAVLRNPVRKRRRIEFVF